MQPIFSDVDNQFLSFYFVFFIFTDFNWFVVMCNCWLCDFFYYVFIMFLCFDDLEWMHTWRHANTHTHAHDFFLIELVWHSIITVDIASEMITLN